MKIQKKFNSKKIQKIKKEKCKINQRYHFLSKTTNNRIHEVAESFNLSHESKEENGNRFVIISKIPISSEKIKFLGGYFGIFGKTIDKIGKTNIDEVSSTYISNREKRDGNIHHTTILLKNELQIALKNAELSKEYSTILSSLKKEFKSDSEIMLNLMSKVLEGIFLFKNQKF